MVDSPRPRRGLLVSAVAMRIGRLSLLLTALASIPTTALATGGASAGVRLSWVRSESALNCISPATLEADLIERMGRNPFEGRSEQWIEGFVVRNAGRYEVQLFERDAGGRTIGSRTFTEISENCRALDDAIELAIALIIDPNVRLLERPRNLHQALPTIPSGQRATATPPPLLPAPQSTQQPTPAQVTPTENAQRATAPSLLVQELPSRSATNTPNPRLHDAPTKSSLDAAHSTDFSAAGLLIGGILPGATPGVELSSRHTEGRYALRLGLRLAPERRPDSELGDFGFGATLFSLGGCARWQSPRLEWSNCLEAGVGAIHVAVYRPAPEKPGDRFFASAGIESGLSVRLIGPVRLDTRLFGLVPLGRWNFQLTENGQTRSVFQQQWFMPGAAVGLSVRFF